MSQSSQLAEKINFRRLVPVRASERVAESIRSAIVSGRFAAEELLPPERKLASRFGVTRNTVREALRRLEQLRLVRIRQGSGVRVRDYLESSGIELLVSLLSTADGFSLDLMRDLLEARAILGEAICCNAIDRLDLAALDDFHEAVEAFAAEAALARPDPRQLQQLEFEVPAQLTRAGGNRAFVLLYNSLRHIYEQVAHRFEHLVAEPHQLAERYREVAEALHAGDRGRAKQIFREHFAASVQVLAAEPEP
jgi:DNA-binding FadR family transcriptional regulator